MSTQRRSSGPITITLQVRASNEDAARRILDHPTLRALVEQLGAGHGMGGQDRLEEKPFREYDSTEFQENVMLRARAAKWLVGELMLPDVYPQKEAVGSITEAKELTITHIQDNLPMLSDAIESLINRSGIAPTGEPIQLATLDRSYGYAFVSNGALRSVSAKLIGMLVKVWFEHESTTSNEAHDMARGMAIVELALHEMHFAE
jgi:hypothetical protein